MSDKTAKTGTVTVQIHFARSKEETQKSFIKSAERFARTQLVQQKQKSEVA